MPPTLADLKAPPEPKTDAKGGQEALAADPKQQEQARAKEELEKRRAAERADRQRKARELNEAEDAKAEKADREQELYGDNTLGGKAKKLVTDEVARIKKEGWQGEGDDGETVGNRVSEDRKTVKGGISKDGISFEQEGLIQDADGEDRFGKVAIGKEGLEADGLQIANGWKFGFKAGPNEQKINVSAPTEWVFPPPNGLDMDLIPEVPVMIFPGLSVAASAGITGQIKLDDINLVLERKVTTEGDNPYERVTRWGVNGSGEFGAAAGIQLEVVIIGGVPVVANVRLGVRAKAEAKVGTQFEVGGHLDLTHTIPAPGEKAEHTDTDGQAYINLVGGGSIAAALSAFVGVEILTIKGDLVEITIVDVPLANLNVGGRIGGEYSSGSWSALWQPAYGTKSMPVEYDWLLKRYFKVKKLDAAKAGATDTKAEITALKQLKAAAGSEVDMDKLLSNPDFDQAAIINAEVKQLMLKKEKLQTLVQSESEGVTQLTKDINGPLAKKNAELKKKRWAITNWFKGDSDELKNARKNREKMEDALAKHQLELDGIDGQITEARARFLKNIDLASIDALIAAAKQKKHDTRRKNFALLEQELTELKNDYEPKIKSVDEDIAKLVPKVEALRERVRKYDEVGKGEIAAHKDKLKELEAAEKKAESTYVAAQKEHKKHRTDVLEPLQQQEDEKAKKKSFFSKVFSRKDAGLAEAQGKDAELKKASDKANSAYTKARSSRQSHAKNDPLKKLEQQLAQAETDLMLLEQKHARLSSDYDNEKSDRQLLMLGEWTKAQKDGDASGDTRKQKMEKYAKDYGKEGKYATAEAADKARKEKEKDKVATP